MFENSVSPAVTLDFGFTMKQARTLTEKQLKMVLAHCATRRHAARDRAIIAVSHLAGLRAKEIAALTLGNVMNDERTVRSEFVLAPSQTKGAKSRRVFVSTKLRKELEQYLSQARLRRNCPYLFQSQKGSAFSPNTMCQLIIGIYEECGLEGATSHSGRRSLITNLANKGISIKILAEIAGHSSIQNTARYISVNDDLMRAAVELV